MSEADKGIQDRIEAAQLWARSAGEILLSYRGSRNQVDSKGIVDFVSEADRAAQAIILESVQSTFPGDGYLFEEDEAIAPSSSGFEWVVDPLDGTTNFIHDHPHFAVSIGLKQGEERVGGVIFAPMTGEMFSARKGGGTHFNGERVGVSAVERVEEALVGTGFPYNRREILDVLLPPLERAMKTAQGVRRAGAAALDLAYVAVGRLDGFWERGLSPWDICAGIVLIEEAGGLVTDGHGMRAIGSPEVLVASNGTIHEGMMDRIVQENGCPRAEAS